MMREAPNPFFQKPVFGFLHGRLVGGFKPVTGLLPWSAPRFHADIARIQYLELYKLPLQGGALPPKLAQQRQLLSRVLELRIRLA
jgi:hypothetical protein